MGGSHKNNNKLIKLSNESDFVYEMSINVLIYQGSNYYDMGIS